MRAQASGTKVGLDYVLEEYLDEDSIEELDCFMESEQGTVAEVLEEMEDAYSEEIRLVRIKFMSEVANHVLHPTSRRGPGHHRSARRMASSMPNSPCAVPNGIRDRRLQCPVDKSIPNHFLVEAEILAGHAQGQVDHAVGLEEFRPAAALVGQADG